MTVRVNKPAIKLNEKLAEKQKNSGIAGEAMLRAETPQEQQALIGVGRKNIIINGDMQVAQRGTSATFGQSDKGYKTVDRFKVWEQGTPTATFNLTRESDAPTGFEYSTKLACATANTSGIPASVHMYLQYSVERQDLFQLGWGSNDAKPATMSFWAKSNTSGTYVVSFIAYDGTDYDYYTAPYELDGSGNWQYITLPIPPNTITDVAAGGTTGTGLLIYWVIQSSTTYSGSTSPLTKWTESPSTNQHEAGQTADLGETVGNYWQITGVQLEAGNVATPFEHRRYSEELRLCQRYYHKESHTSANFGFVGMADNSTSAYMQHIFPTTMRAAPTIETTGVAGNYSIRVSGNTLGCSHVPNFSSANTNVAHVQWRVSSGLTGGHAVIGKFDGGNVYVAFDAEL